MCGVRYDANRSSLCAPSPSWGGTFSVTDRNILTEWIVAEPIAGKEHITNWCIAKPVTVAVNSTIAEWSIAKPSDKGECEEV